MGVLNSRSKKILAEVWLVVFVVLPLYVDSHPLASLSEDKDIVFIKMSIARTPATSFTNYPILSQEIEADQTLYKSHTGAQKNGKVIYRRKSNDAGQKVVILTESEDDLDYTNEGEDNRIYVVLIQNPLDATIYHTAYAYARNVPPGEPVDASVITINREHRRIEWDIWDERGCRRNKAATFGWTTCLESFLIPCKPVFPDVDDDDQTKDDMKTLPSKQSKRLQFQTEEGLDAGENFDFFGDLDDSNHEANFVGAVTNTITDAVQFFAEVMHSGKDNQEVVGIKNPEDFLMHSRNFIKSLTNDLKGIGLYSFPDDGKSRSANVLLSEGYRVVLGLLKNSVSDQEAENMTITVFTDDDKPPADQPMGISGRGAKQISSTSNSLQANQVGNESEKSGRGLFGPGGLLGGIFGPKENKAGSSGVNAQGVHVQGYIPGKVGGKINGEDWRTFCARPNLSEGDKTYCSCHIGKDTIFGISEDIGDSVSQILTGHTVNDNPSGADEVFNTLIPAVFCGTTGKAIDLVNTVIGKHLGIDKVLGVLGQAAGTFAGVVEATKLGVAHLFHQGIKVVAQGLGLGEVIGMSSSNVNGGVLNGISGRGLALPGIQTGSNESIAEVQTDVEMFGHIGWRTQDVDSINDIPANGLSSSFFHVPFIGIGTCPMVEVNHDDITESDNVHDIAKLYHSILRTSCFEKQSLLLSDLILDGTLELNSDKTLSMSDSCLALKTPVISERQIDRISLGFSIAVFSQVYMEQIKHPELSNSVNPSGDPISRPIQAIVKFALTSLGEFRRVSRVHYIKLARDLVRTLKTIFSKSLQDFYRFSHCYECEPNNKVEANYDVLTLLGLIQFIVEGLGPVETLGHNFQNTWLNFFKQNRDLLVTKLEFYTQHL